MTSQKTISLPATPSLDDLLRAWAELTEPGAHVTLHLGSLMWVSPVVVTFLVGLIQHAATIVAEVDVVCPFSDDVHTYLTRADFYRDLPNNVHLDRPPAQIRRNDKRSTLVEVTQLAVGSDTATVGQRLYDATLALTRDDAAAVAIATAVSEASANVLEHAMSPTGAVLAAQSYRGGTLEMAVADTGRGIRESLADNPDLSVANDEDGIRLALQANISRLRDDARGGGLPDVIKRTRTARGAVLEIGSGNARARLFHTGTGQWREDVHRSPHRVPGTFVALQLRA